MAPALPQGRGLLFEAGFRPFLLLGRISREMDAERGLMARVARGDQAAFTELAQRYSGKLLAVAGRLLGSRADAEDAVQRAFLQCFAAAAGYDPRWAVSTWLYRILTNVCVDELRRRATGPASRYRARRGCCWPCATSTGSPTGSWRASGASRSTP